jgi:hypothetical protein
MSVAQAKPTFRDRSSDSADRDQRGRGDILTGSLAGAEAGMAALWAVPAGVILKWTLTEGIARWQMATGTTLLEGWVTRLGRWIQWVFFGYLLLFSLVTGGMLASACGVAGAALIPLGEPQTSRFVWGAMHSLAGLALIWIGGYALLKRILAVCVGAMFLHGHPDRVPARAGLGGCWPRADSFDPARRAQVGSSG